MKGFIAPASNADVYTSANLSGRGPSIWLRKTGELVASGMGTECARRLGYASRNSFYSVLSHHRKGAGGQKPLRKYDFLVEELTAEELAQLDRHNKKREPGGVTAPTSPAR